MAKKAKEMRGGMGFSDHSSSNIVYGSFFIYIFCCFFDVKVRIKSQLFNKLQAEQTEIINSALAIFE